MVTEQKQPYPAHLLQSIEKNRALAEQNRAVKQQLELQHAAHRHNELQRIQQLRARDHQKCKVLEHNMHQLRSGAMRKEQEFAQERERLIETTRVQQKRLHAELQKKQLELDAVRC